MRELYNYNLFIRFKTLGNKVSFYSSGFYPNEQSVRDAVDSINEQYDSELVEVFYSKIAR